MAKKQTYAAAMKQLSKKKATYEQGLAEAKRTMNSSGIKDYERRLGRLSAGMDELFQSQEVSKNPQFGLGGSTMEYGYGGKTKISEVKSSKDMYAEGGLTQSTFAEYKMLNSMLPQQRSAAENARLNQLQGAVDTASKMGWQEGFGFNPDGSMAGRPIPGAEVATEAPPTEPYTGPSITPEGAMRKFQAPAPTLSQGQGSDVYQREFSKPAPQSVEPANVGNPGVPNFQSFGPTDGTQYPPHNPINTPPSVATTATTATATAASPAATRPQNVEPIATRNDVGLLGSPVASPSFRSELDDVELGNFETDYIAEDEVTNTLSPVTRAQYAAAEDAYDKSQRGPNFFQKNKQTLGMAAGMAAQFIPDLMAKRNIRKMEGPADMPQMRAQTLNTDIQVGKGLEQIRNSQARMNESVAQNFSNPAVAAAMLRANERSAQAQAGDVLFREAQGENQLRNQNINQLTNTINQNAQIGFQNQQRGIDFENERMGAINRVNMQMGQKLGGAFNDFQTRAQDQKKWEMYAKVFNEDMLKRQGIDPLS